jgi:hypothetical protein
MELKGRESKDLTEFIKSMEESLVIRKEIAKGKNADYVGDETKSVTDNFDRVATMCRIRASSVALILAAVKIVRLASLDPIKGRAFLPENESIEDSVRDLIQYVEFYRFLKEKEKNGSEKENIREKI